MESFFHTLKTELVHHRDYLTRDEARRDMFEYIEVFYNRQRRHSTLGYLSPVRGHCLGRMRHPVSTLLSRREGLCCFVRLWIVGLMVGPGAPEDPDPGAGQNTDGMGVIAAASPLVDVGGPGGGMARIVGEAG